MESTDTRTRYTVTVEISGKWETPEDARAFVGMLLEPLPMVKPISVSHPPEVVGVKVCGDKPLDPSEEVAFEDILKAAGIEKEPGA